MILHLWYFCYIRINDQKQHLSRLPGISVSRASSSRGNTGSIWMISCGEQEANSSGNFPLWFMTTPGFASSSRNKSGSFSFGHHLIWLQRGLPILPSIDLVLCSLPCIQVTSYTTERAFPPANTRWPTWCALTLSMVGKKMGPNLSIVKLCLSAVRKQLHILPLVISIWCFYLF